MRRALLAAGIALGIGACEDSTHRVDSLAVVYIGPSPGAVGVGVDSDVRVTFSEVLRPDTVNQAAICIVSADADTDSCSGAGVVPSQVSYDAPTFAITVQPLLLLTTSHDYTLRITSDIRGDSGSLHAPIDSQFRTAP